MGLAEKGEHMVLTHGIKHNILFQHHLIVFHSKHTVKMLRCILIHSTENLGIHPRDALRCVHQSFPVHILADALQQKLYRLFYLILIYHDFCLSTIFISLPR